MLTAVLGLFAIIGVGSLVGATGVLRDPRAVITWLNRYALYLAFPLLIAHKFGGQAATTTICWRHPGNKAP